MGCGSCGKDGMEGQAMNRAEKKWGGFNLTAMEMKQRRLIKDSLEEQRGLGSLSSLSHTCWCSSRPIYYRPRLLPTTTSEIFMSSSSVFWGFFGFYFLHPVTMSNFFSFHRRWNATSGCTQAPKENHSSKIFSSVSPGCLNSQNTCLFCFCFSYFG